MKRVKRFFGLRFESTLELAPLFMSGAAVLFAFLAFVLAFASYLHASSAMQSANECTRSMAAMTDWAEVATGAIARNTTSMCKTIKSLGIEWPKVCN